MLVFVEEGKLECPEKNQRTNNNLNPRMASTHWPHWWEASALITAPSLDQQASTMYLCCNLGTLLWILVYRHPAESAVTAFLRVPPLFYSPMYLFHLLFFLVVSQLCPSVMRWLQSASSQTCVRACYEASWNTGCMHCRTSHRFHPDKVNDKFKE